MMTSYRITNRGSLPEFISTQSPMEAVNIDQFDRFQENFLQNYLNYVQTQRLGDAQ